MLYADAETVNFVKVQMLGSHFWFCELNSEFSVKNDNLFFRLYLIPLYNNIGHFFATVYACAWWWCWRELEEVVVYSGQPKYLKQYLGKV